MWDRPVEFRQNDKKHTSNGFKSIFRTFFVAKFSILQ